MGGSGPTKTGVGYYSAPSLDGLDGLLLLLHVVGIGVRNGGHRGVYSIEAWTQPASLKKRGGNENHAYFRENWGEEKLRGKKN